MCAKVCTNNELPVGAHHITTNFGLLFAALERHRERAIFRRNKRKSCSNKRNYTTVLRLESLLTENMLELVNSLFLMVLDMGLSLFIYLFDDNEQMDKCCTANSRFAV